MQDIQWAKENIPLALIDAGLSECHIHHDGPSSVRFMDAVDDGLWLGALMLSIDQVAVQVTQKRLFDVRYMACDAAADGIRAIDASSPDWESDASYDGRGLLSEEVEGRALQSVLMRWGCHFAIIRHEDNGVSLRTPTPVQQPDNTLIPFPNVNLTALVAFGMLMMDNAGNIERLRQLGVRPAPRFDLERSPQ